MSLLYNRRRRAGGSDPLDAVKAINFDPARSGFWAYDEAYQSSALVPSGAGDPVGYVVDTLGGGNDIEQTNVALQPTRQTTPNNIMQLDGTQDYFPIPFIMSDARFVVAMAYHDPSAYPQLLMLGSDDGNTPYAVRGQSGSTNTLIINGGTLNDFWADGVLQPSLPDRIAVWEAMRGANVSAADLSLSADPGWAAPRVGMHTGGLLTAPPDLAALLIMQVDAPLTDAENAAVQSLMESYL